MIQENVSVYLKRKNITLISQITFYLRNIVIKQPSKNYCFLLKIVNNWQLVEVNSYSFTQAYLLLKYQIKRLPPDNLVFFDKALFPHRHDHVLTIKKI